MASSAPLHILANYNLPLNRALAVFQLLGTMNITKHSIAKLMSRFIAIILGILIYSAIAPSLMSNSVAIQEGIEPTLINPNIILALIILIPVVFCMQSKLRWLKLTGWLLLCLMLAFIFVQ